MKAWICPGQGAQSVGMLSEVAESFAIVKQTFEEASDVLKYDLWAVTQQDADRLGQTEVTQPALLTASVALWRAFESEGGDFPDCVAGHSLGEYSACVIAGALPFHEAVALVAKRGQLMQSAVPLGQGAMAVILGCDDEAVVALCEASAEGEVLSAANFNSPGQVVISGQAEAVNRAVAQAKSVGARRGMIIPVSVPSHCELMRPAAEAFDADLKACSWSLPKVPLVHNVNAKTADSVEGIMTALSAQLYSPVKWVACVNALIEMGVTCFVECGPGQVLTGLNKRITPNTMSVTLNRPADFDTLPDR